MFNRKHAALLGALVGLHTLDQKEHKRYIDSEKHNLETFKNPPIPKGCKQYTIDGVTVVAISEKSAHRKVNKILKNKIL